MTGVSNVGRWTYTPIFKLASPSVDQGTTVNYAYDADDVLRQVGSLLITRGAMGVFTITSLFGVATSMSYDSFGDLTAMSASYGGSPILSTNLSKDALGRGV